MIRTALATFLLLFFASAVLGADAPATDPLSDPAPAAAKPAAPPALAVSAVHGLKVGRMYNVFSEGVMLESKDGSVEMSLQSSPLTVVELHGERAFCVLASGFGPSCGWVPANVLREFRWWEAVNRTLVAAGVAAMPPNGSLPVKGDELQLLRGKTVERLKIDLCETGNLAPLAEVVGLRMLQLTAVGAANLAALADLKDLEAITCSDKRVLRYLEGLPKLARVHCYAAGDVSAELASLTKVPALKVIWVTPNAAGSLQALSGHPNLEEVGIIDVGSRRADEWSGLNSLRQLTRLKRVSLMISGLKDADLACLAGSGECEYLRLVTEGLSADGLAAIPDLPKLRYLNVVSSGVSPQGVAALAKLPRLRGLELAFAPVSDGLFSALGTLSALEELNLTAKWDLADRQTRRVTPKGFAALSGLKNLRRFSYIGDGLDDEGLGSIVALSKLEVLSFSGPAVTDQGMRELTKLPGLVMLGLNDVRVTSGGLAEMAALPNVRGISIVPNSSLAAAQIKKVGESNPRCAIFIPEEPTPIKAAAVQAATTAKNPLSPPLRTYQDATGKYSVDAFYRGYDGAGTIILQKKDGEVIRVPLEKLSEADQEYLQSLRQAAGAKR